MGFQEGVLLPVWSYPRGRQPQGARQGDSHLLTATVCRCCRFSATAMMSRTRPCAPTAERPPHWALQDYEPGGALENVYSRNTMEEYKNMGDRQSSPPHAWNLASHCWQMLMAQVLVPPAESFNQAIVITGESGAGKSFQVPPLVHNRVSGEGWRSRLFVAFVVACYWCVLTPPFPVADQEDARLPGLRRRCGGRAW